MSQTLRPLLSVIVPCFNEEGLLRENTLALIAYLESLEPYRWELLIINDGSSDDTGEIANQLADQYAAVRTLHHPSNFGVGQAMRFGFANTRGDYVVTLDVDLSYAARHIGEMLEKLISSHAKVVLASPYMNGGEVKNVPVLRRLLSVLGNRFLKVFVRGNYSTITSMARAYDGPYIRSLDLRATGLDLMPEILHKSLVVHAKVVECPATLDWGPQLAYGDTRVSSMKILRHVMSTIRSGFTFRPVYFLVIPGILAGLFALYMNFHLLAKLWNSTESTASLGEQISAIYSASPNLVMASLIATALSVQFFALGVLAIQNTRYFEDLYNQNSEKLKKLQREVLELSE